MAQVEAAVVLSVVVRWGPVRTAVNGTVVARPAMTRFVGCGLRRRQLDRRVRLDPGDVCLVAKSPEAARQLSRVPW